MPTIVFASSKGGAGKTTAAIILACELARQGKSKGINVTLVDSDPNQHTASWALKEGCPDNINLIAHADEESILDAIDAGRKQSGFVLVDLEGTASVSVTNAIIRADLVIIPCQGSQDDAEEAVKTMKLIKNQGRVLNRNIPYSVLFMRTNPAITPRTLAHILNNFKKSGVDLFECSLIDREAFRAIRSFGGAIYNLDKKEVSGIDKAVENARIYAVEVIKKLKNNQISEQNRSIANG